MSGLIVDASIVVTWLFDDEEEPWANRVLEQLAQDWALVPQLWHLETRNSSLTAERRDLLSSEEVKERLGALKGLPITTEEKADLQPAFDLARAHGLSLYDAIYLELATREGADLATLDTSLGQAAVVKGVPLSATWRHGK